jgi:hypothetical protein
MTKHIRPLTAFKKLNPELYALYSDVFEKKKGLSKKAQENEFYWNYAYFKMNEKALITPPPFFWKSENNRNNKLTISELGRLLLTGWHYNIEEYTLELLRYVERSYYKKVKENEAFNDLEIHSVVKHLRENIIYYYQNKDECKFYILDKLFNKTLKSILPPLPEKLKKHEELIDLLTEIRKNQIAKGIDFWINKADELENKVYELEAYADYLKEGIVSYGTGDFLTFDDYKKQIDEEDEVLNQQEEVDKNNTNEIQVE